MMNFKMYFFKDRSDSIDIQKVFGFFEMQEHCVFSYPDEQVRITYDNEALKCTADFFLKKRSLVPNIYKLNPKYSNLNFHVEIPPLLPDYKISVLFDLIGNLSRTFNLGIYCELFENILTFKDDVCNAAYSYFKKAYKQAYKNEYDPLYYVEKSKLDNILKYIGENIKLQLYYKDEELYIPKLIILAVADTKEIYTAVEWKEDTKTVFPSFLDYVYYKTSDETRTIKYKFVNAAIEKFLDDLPGFIPGTKVINDSNAKKVRKIMRKTKFNPVSTKFIIVDQEKLIDI